MAKFGVLKIVRCKLSPLILRAKILNSRGIDIPHYTSVFMFEIIDLLDPFRHRPCIQDIRHSEPA